MDLRRQIAGQARLAENAEVEYKSAKGGFPKSFWETLSAFANTEGGTIVLGVGEKSGRLVPDGLTEEQTAACRKQFWDDAHNKSCISIPMLVESDIKEIATEGGARLLVFSVPMAPFDLRPVYLTLNPLGHTYQRRHEGDYVCTDDEVRQMFSDANSRRNSVDARILRGYTIDDIDLRTLHQYRQVYSLRHDGHPWNNDSDMQFLEHVGAYRKDRATSSEGFTVAGMIMFGKTDAITDPECCQNFFPDYREHTVLDRGVRWTDRLYPDGTWEANLYQFYLRVLPRLHQLLPLPFRLDSQMYRVDTTSAHVSVREALANTLIHCAYTVMGNITIDRYPDRIVMSNPGTMLISMGQYKEGGHSVCRNPLLQKMFVMVGVGEKCGSGADIIAKGWTDNGWTPLPAIEQRHQPERIETTMNIVATQQPASGDAADKPAFDRERVKRYLIKVLSGNEDGLSGNDDVLSGNEGGLSGNEDTISVKSEALSVKSDDLLAQDDTINASDDTINASNDAINASDDTINGLLDVLIYLYDNPMSRSESIAESIRKSRVQVKRYLSRLVKAGLVKTEGGNKNRTYSATNSNYYAQD